MQPSAEKIWSSAQSLLRTLLNSDIFNLWFASIQPVELQGETLVLSVANDFCELWLNDNYLGLIQDALMHAAGRQLKVQFRVASAPMSGQAPTELAPRPKELEDQAE